MGCYVNLNPCEILYLPIKFVLIIMGHPSADLSLFRALGVEGLRAPFALADQNLLPENLVFRSSLSRPFRTHPGFWAAASSTQWINQQWDALYKMLREKKCYADVQH
ncbi:hypothetical protein TNCV_1211641 [Trichonephila clavipes]|nr:hypothetical protein TNCV_1211641 [Trichonephila clavipes]